MKLEDFPNLMASLSNENKARIQTHLAGDLTKASNRERIVSNPHKEKLQWLSLSEDRAVEDVILGACRAEQSSGGKLLPTRVFALLASKEQISTAYIQGVFSLDERQARRYMAACKLAISQLTRHFSDTPLSARTLSLAEIRQAKKGNQ